MLLTFYGALLWNTEQHLAVLTGRKKTHLNTCVFSLLYKGLGDTFSGTPLSFKQKIFERKFCQGFISAGLPLWPDHGRRLEQLLQQRTTVNHS